MPQFENISFTHVNVIFGILQLEGFAEGDDVVSVELTTEQFVSVAGAKGDVARAQTNDNRCTITVKLLQTSLSNKLLTAAYNTDKLTGVGVAPMTIIDKEYGETYLISNAWIQKYPNVTRGQLVNSMDWVFEGDSFTPIQV